TANVEEQVKHEETNEGRALERAASATERLWPVFPRVHDVVGVALELSARLLTHSLRSRGSGQFVQCRERPLRFVDNACGVRCCGRVPRSEIRLDVPLTVSRRSELGATVDSNHLGLRLGQKALLTKCRFAPGNLLSVGKDAAERMVGTMTLA